MQEAHIALQTEMRATSACHEWEICGCPLQFWRIGPISLNQGMIEAGRRVEGKRPSGSLSRRKSGSRAESRWRCRPLRGCIATLRSVTGIWEGSVSRSRLPGRGEDGADVFKSGGRAQNARRQSDMGYRVDHMADDPTR